MRKRHNRLINDYDAGVSSLNPSWLFKSWQFMGYPFLDESGKFADSDFVCMAGYISDDEGWTQFFEKWRKLLLRPEIPYIHMKEMISIRGPYKDLGWTSEQRDGILNEFIDVIRDHIQAGFGVAVDAKYLRSMNADARYRN